MVLLLILILLSLLIFGLYFLFRLVRWVFKKKVRVKWALGIILLVALTSIVKMSFFTKMDFIQSMVYPNLYLVKNAIKDKDYLHRVIKKRVLEKVNNEFLNENGTNEFSKKLMEESSFGIRFYEYYTGTFFLIPFGEAGTVHFIDNKEDPGGFTSEELIHYNNYLIAEFNLEYCKNDTLNYVGILRYYQNRKVIKIDTLINLCQLLRSKELSEPAEIASEKN